MFKSPLLCLAALTAALTLPSPARGAQAVRVFKDRLPLRSAPNLRSRILLRAKKGTKYNVAGRRGAWVQVALSAGRRGWFPRQHVRAAKPGRTEYVQVKTLNVRSGPGSRFRRLGTLKFNQKITVLGGNGNWKRLRFKGREAFVWRAHVSVKRAFRPERRRASRAGYVQLQASGPGFLSYARSSARWGIPRLVYGLERSAYRWKQSGERGKVRIGDLSRENGGALSGHASHRTGRDVDVAPLRRDGRALPVTRFQSAYSRAKTRKYLNLLRKEVRALMVLFNDRGVGGVRPWPGHDNHFHYRVR